MNSIKKNVLYNIVYQILVIILPIITVPYVSRVLGAEGIGVYSYAYSIATYFLLFAMLGVANYGNRSIAMVRKSRTALSKTFWNIFSMQFFTAVFVTIFYVIYVLNFYKEHKLIAIILTIYVMSAMLDISWFYFGIEKFKLIVTTNLSIKIITVLLIFGFVKSVNDLWLYALFMSIGTFVSHGLVWLFIKKYIHFEKPNINDVKTYIKPFIILFLPVLAYSIYRIMDKIMIGNLSNMEQLGYYENADKILIIPMGIITALGTVMLPRSSHLVANGQSDLQKKYIEISMKYVSIIACALLFGLAGISKVLAPVYFGNEFIPSGDVILFMAPIILFASYANVLRTQYLIPNKKDNIYVISMLVAAVLNFVLNYILIPVYGAKGAVVGSITAELSVMIVQAFFIRKELPVMKYFIDNYIYIIFGVVMFWVVRLIGNLFSINLVTLTTQIIMGAVVYCALTIVYMLITKDSFIKILIPPLLEILKKKKTQM